MTTTTTTLRVRRQYYAHPERRCEPDSMCTVERVVSRKIYALKDGTYTWREARNCYASLAAARSACVLGD